MRSLLLAAAGLAAAVHVCGVVLDARDLTVYGQLATLVLLAVYAATGSGGARWALVAGLAALATAVVVDAVRHRADLAWFTYGPLDRAALDAWIRQILDRQIGLSAGTLAAAACFAVAVIWLPPVRRRWLAVTGVAVAVGLVAVTAVRIWGSLDLVHEFWVPALAGLVAAAVVALAGVRGGAGRVGAAGALLFAVPVMEAVVDAAGTAESLRPLDPPGMHMSIAVSFAPSDVDYTLAGLALAVLLGVALLAVGATRGRRAV